jgi:hypothetical protein
MSPENINKILEKLDSIREDFMMIRDGEWEPNEKFCNASIQTVQDVINIIENE